MRILCIGATFPSPEVDHYDWSSADSFYEYDAMIVDPAEGVSRFIEGVLGASNDYLTYDSLPVQDGPSTGTTAGLAELLRRRREETERLLTNGGVVIVLGSPDVPHGNVSGFGGCHRYYWLPAPLGKDYGRDYVKPASGHSASASDFEHPFAGYMEALRGKLVYRASYAEGADGFGEAAKVIGRSSGGPAVAIDLKVGGGHVVFVPLADVSDHSDAGTAMVKAIRNLLLQDAEESAPGWLSEYELPGIAEAKKRLDAAESKLDDAEGELDEASDGYKSIDRDRRLLWQEGKFGFDLPVRDVLAKLGCSSSAGVDEPARFSFDGETFLVETQSAAGAVGMEPHYRLRQRLERQIADRGERVLGVIVINGHRRFKPGDRSQEYEDALRVAAESMRYCVIEARYLFEALKAQMEGGGDSAALIRRMLATEGVYEPAAAPQEPPSEPVEAETAPSPGVE